MTFSDLDGEKFLISSSDVTTIQAAITLWNKLMRRCINSFEFDDTLLGYDIVVDTVKPVAWPQSWNSRVRIEDSRIILPNISFTAAPLIKAAYAREIFSLLMFHDVVAEPVIYDLACEYGRQQISNERLDTD